MFRKLIFHIGDIKSGTTSIQATLAGEGGRIGGVDYLYPARFNHNYLRRHMAQDDPAPLTSARYKTGPGAEDRASYPRPFASLHQMGRHLREQDGDVCIISAETFQSLDPEIFARQIERHFSRVAREIQIISYFRPHVDRLKSAYAEQVKIGAYGRSFADFLRDSISRRRFFYAERAGNWRRVFGAAHVVRPMLRSSLYRGDVVADFLKLALETEAFDSDIIRQTNTSLSPAGIEAARRFQAELEGLPAELRHSLGYEFARFFSEAPQGPEAGRMTVPAQLAERFAKAHAEDAARMDAGFFGGEALFGPALDKGRTAITAQAPTDPAPLVGADLTLRSMGRLVRRLAETNPEEIHRKLRHQRQDLYTKNVSRPPAG